MIILDTNVISEVLRSGDDHPAVRWLSRQRLRDLATTAICKAEMLAGAAVMTAGAKRTLLLAKISEAFEVDFARRVLPFDEVAAGHFAEIVAIRRQLGRPVGELDAQIAAITRANGASVATTDIDGFSGVGVELIDPWSA